MLILDLAIRGRLTQGAPSVPTGGDILPSLPGTWRWRTVADIAAPEASAITDGPFGSHLKTEHYVSRSGYRVVRLQNIERLAFKLAHQTYISRDRYESLRKHEVFAGDLVIAGLVDPNLRCAEIPADLGPAIVKADCYRLKVRREMNRRFVLFYLNSPTCQRFAAGHHHGMTLTRIGLGNFKRIPVPVPPREEQDHIVAQVNRLLALCDEYESALGHRDDVRDKLRSSSLAPLTGSKGMPGKASEKEVAFVLSHSSRMVTRPAHVADVRRAILHLAAWGRLTSGVRSEERSAETLLRDTADKRAQLLHSDWPNPGEAKLQLKKQSQQTLPRGLPALPGGWTWATLMQCCALVVDCRNKTVPYTSSGIRLIRTTNIRDGRMVLDDPRFVSAETYELWSSRYKPQPGDILITREAPMGEVCRIPDGETVCLGQRVMLASVVPKTIDPDFLLCSLRDPALMDRVQDKPIGATVEHLRVGGVETLMIPLPPPDEQRRIVAKVNELMAVCDDLERSLAAVEVGRTRALEAVLHEVLEEVGDNVPALVEVAG